MAQFMPKNEAREDALPTRPYVLLNMPGHARRIVSKTDGVIDGPAPMEHQPRLQSISTDEKRSRPLFMEKALHRCVPVCESSFCRHHHVKDVVCILHGS